MNAEKKNPATVRFIGDEEYYRYRICDDDFKYCRDSECDTKCCDKPPVYQFIKGKTYPAYFLEYWEGVRDSLHVRGEDGEVDDFIDFSDFEVVEDVDNVLNTYEATVRYIGSSPVQISTEYGHEYKALGYRDNGTILVLDDSGCCYFYSPSDFEIIEDAHGVLDKTRTPPIYAWH